MLRLLLALFLVRMMPPLPTVGGDTNAWGTEVNAFLSVAHDPATGNLLDAAVSKATINAQTGTAYTLVNADGGKIVSMTNAAANTITILSDANMSGGALPIGTSIVIRQGGAGQTTIIPGAGTTLNSRGGIFKIAGQYGWATLIKVAANAWELTGDLT